jgi:integrase/predicted DNA-binding transcriptional regulator AlpA
MVARVRRDAVDSRAEAEALPAVLYVPDLAALLRISEKAVRHRAARGLVPPPVKLGRALAWTREVVLEWLRDSGRAAGTVDVKITLRPYAKDKNRWQIDIRLMNPSQPQTEIRRRMVAPGGHDQKQARTWGERQVAALLRELVGEGAKVEAPAPDNVGAPTKWAPRKEVAKPSSRPMTLDNFYKTRFEPEHVELLKPATRDYYRTAWALYIGPMLGALPLVAIDDDRISAFRAGLRKKLAASTSNIILSKVALMLRFARKMRAIETVPIFERLPEPRRRPKEVYSEEQIAAMMAVARRHGTDALVILLLALDAGLRVSEICALEWRDIDLKEGTVLIQRSVYEGVVQTPKGTIGKLALTRALREALEAHRLEANHGPLVVYRRPSQNKPVTSPHNPGTIWTVLGRIQAELGLKKAGPHLLRHTALTRLANLGASVYVVQSVARHAHLQTTQVYLHTQQTGLSREAANLLDRATAAGGFGNALATPATTAPNPR